jgi:hypothetical protein
MEQLLARIRAILFIVRALIRRPQSLVDLVRFARQVGFRLA